MAWLLAAMATVLDNGGHWWRLSLWLYTLSVCLPALALLLFTVAFAA
jgi:hypothetical protein